ncbi:MAG: hypothetical protein ABSB49_22325 [Polyangia bacterium]|jgi:hypothetical protein
MTLVILVRHHLHPSQRKRARRAGRGWATGFALLCLFVLQIGRAGAQPGQGGEAGEGEANPPPAHNDLVVAPVEPTRPALDLERSGEQAQAHSLFERWWFWAAAVTAAAATVVVIVESSRGAAPPATNLGNQVFQP